MSFILRDYQEEAVLSCIKILNSNKKNCKELIVAPTGAGKSIIIAETVKAIKEPIVIIQPSKELLKQNYEKYIKVGGKASMCCASLKTSTKKGIDYTTLEDGSLVECKKITQTTYATVGTINKFIKELKKLKVTKAVVDEVHLGSKSGSQLRKFFKEVGITHVVGLTATPIYLQGGLNGASLKMMNRVRGKLFSNISHVTQINHLVENNFWTKLKYQINDTDETYLKENSNGSDFTVQSQKDYYKSNNLKEQIKEEVFNLKKEKRKSTLIFVPTIEEAEDLMRVIPNSIIVHSKIDTNTRDYAITSFKNLEIPVVINIGVLLVGFDHPRLDSIIMARSTSSIAIHYQSIGRGVRIHPDKVDCKVVDFSGNVKRFGRVEGLHYENVPYYGWGLFNEKNELLTDFPISAKTRPTKETLIETGKKEIKNKENKINPEFTFGMFKGRKLWDIAQSKDADRLKSYCSWVIDKYNKNEWNFHGTEGNNLKNGIFEYLKIPKHKSTIKKLPF